MRRLQKVLWKLQTSTSTKRLSLVTLWKKEERLATAEETGVKKVNITVPGIVFEDNEVSIKVSPATEWSFRNANEWATFKNDCELSYVVEDATGERVSFFADLVSGCTYTGHVRPSTGLALRIGNVEGENRSRVNAAEDEFGEALVRVVAEEEGVSIADVTPRPDLRQVFDVTATSSDAAKAEFDAVLEVKKHGRVVSRWAGAHRVKMKDYAAVKQLKDAETKFVGFVKEPERFPILKDLTGFQGFNKAVYAEHYQFDAPNFERFKAACQQDNVMLLRQGGSRLVKVSAQLKLGSHNVRRSLPLTRGQTLSWR